jgi:CBS domain-containing protein
MNPQELLKVVTADSEDASLTAVFHRLNSVLPENQRMVTITPETKASEALRVMRQHGFSQLPVIVGNEVLGLFSHRSFADAVLAIAAEANARPISPIDLTVEDCIEKAVFARVTDEFNDWFDALDSHDAVVGEEKVSGTDIDKMESFW